MEGAIADLTDVSAVFQEWKEGKKIGQNNEKKKKKDAKKKEREVRKEDEGK